MGFFHCNRGMLISPGKRAQMVSPQHDLVERKSSNPRRRMNKPGELPGCLPGIPTLLVDLAGCRFHTEERLVCNRIVKGCFNNRGVSGANRVHAAPAGTTVTL